MRGHQAYSYIGCGPVNTVWTYLATSTTELKTTTTMTSTTTSQGSQQSEQAVSSSVTKPPPNTNSPSPRAASENTSSKKKKQNVTGPNHWRRSWGSRVDLHVDSGRYILAAKEPTYRPPVYTSSIDSLEGRRGKKKTMVRSTAQELQGSTAQRSHELEE